LIKDLAFVEKAASANDRDAVSIAFGRLAGAPLGPATIARVARTEQLAAFTESGRGSLIVSSAEGSEAEDGGALTLLVGNGDRLPYASLGLSSISLDGHVVNAVALGLTVGSVTCAPPAFSNGLEASLTWTGDTADIDGDGRDEAVWVMSKVDHEHCAMVIIGLAASTGTFAERATIDLAESCAIADVKLVDADGDGSRDIVLLTGALGGGGRKLLVFWNQGQGRFSTSAVLHLNAENESPQAFSYLRPIPGRAASLVYVTESALVLAESTGQRQFRSRALAEVVRGSGVVAADINGDQADDLIVAASGNLFAMTAQLRAP
jgi:hypothetical protein